ncbi:MAG: transglutaminase domain-containing protein [Lachnospiraceae bacterium]
MSEEKKEVVTETMAQPVTEEASKQRKAPKKGKKTVGHVIACVVAVLLVGGVGTSIGMNVMFMNRMNTQNEKVSRFIDDERARQAKEAEQESDYQEDGFKVMDQYEIRSTTHISDAYLKDDPSGLSGEDKETYDMAKSVLDEIIKDNMSGYEKELAIYEWMVENIGQGSGHIISMPGQNSQAFTPHEVLKSHSAVCVGYATTFRLLANMVGLEVHIVHNDYHSWDMVKLDDGEWYQLDIYSDVNGARYRNFNMTDEMARNGHEWDGSSLPEAKGTKYSYAVQNAVAVKDLFEVPAKVRPLLGEKKSASLYFKFPQKPDEKNLALADQMMNLMQQAMYSVPGVDSKDLSAAWIPDGEDSLVLAIYVNDYTQANSSLEDAVPEKVTKMTNKINELFGSQVMDPNQSGAVPEPMPVEDGAAEVPEKAAGVPEQVADTVMEQEIIGEADGPTATVSATEADEMEKTVNEAMNSEPEEVEQAAE